MRLAWDSQQKTDKAQGQYQRERSAEPYHSYRWTRLSRAYRATHPLCAECQRQGRITAAAVVDHIIPWPVCEDFYDEKNFQSLCEKCNHDKGQRDKRIIQAWRNTHQQNQKK